MRGSEKGPSHWGELKKEWSACKHGHMQSPIDLSCARVQIIPRCQLLFTDYFSSNATIINRGHDIAVSLSLPPNFSSFFPLLLSIKILVRTGHQNYSLILILPMKLY